jgi:hypothetical protein
MREDRPDLLSKSCLSFNIEILSSWGCDIFLRDFWDKRENKIGHTESQSVILMSAVISTVYDE